MTSYQYLFLAWVAVTTGLAGVTIYRALVGLHEDDQLFLDPVEAGFEREQKEIVHSLNGLDRAVHGLMWGSGVLLAVMIGAAVFRALV